MTLQDFAHDIIQDIKVELIYYEKEVDGLKPLQTMLEVGRSQGLLRSIEIVESALVNALEERECYEQE